MTNSRISIVAGALVVTACLLTSESEAQSIAQRVQAVPEGKVRMTFASRPDLCGWGYGISHTDDGYWNRGRGSSNSDNLSDDVVFDDHCIRGPVRLVITKRDGDIDRIRAYIGGRWRDTPNTTDLGQVSVRDAVDYLFDVANSGRGRGAHEAVFPTTIADSVNVTQRLYDLARNDTRDESTREQAIFWLGQQGND